MKWIERAMTVVIAGWAVGQLWEAAKEYKWSSDDE